MKTVVFAYHNIGCVGIEALIGNGFDIAAVFTYADNKNENIWFDSVFELCKRKSIDCYLVEDVNAPQWVCFIRNLSPDIVFSFYYRDLLREEILSIPPKGCLNLHGSLLPKYRGRCPVNWAVINGESETGVTLHYMTVRPDEGDIVAQRAFPIGTEDTAKDVHLKAARQAALLLKDILPLLRSGQAPRIRQDNASATYFHGRKPEDGLIDWTISSYSIKCLVRGVSDPYPGAFTHLGNHKITIWKASMAEGNYECAPGTVVSVNPLIVSCGNGALEILDYQCENQDIVFVVGDRFVI